MGEEVGGDAKVFVHSPSGTASQESRTEACLSLHDGDASLTLTNGFVRATTAWCQATIPLNLGPHELPRLREGLQRLVADEHGSELWTNEDGEVRIETVMAKRGETHWSVRLQAPPDFLHELRLVFVGRQEDLPSLIERLAPR